MRLIAMISPILRPGIWMAQKTNPLYSTYRWQKMRSHHRRHNPTCAECERSGILTLATDVDHIIPHKNNPELMWDTDNLQSLCKPCHNRKTMSESNLIASRTPQWLPITPKPLTVVCGRPQSGKSTYIAEHAHPKHLIIDTANTAERNAMLYDYMTAKTKHAHAWLETSAPSFKERKYWRDRDCSVIVLETDLDQCLNRIQNMNAPEATKQAILGGCKAWH